MIFHELGQLKLRVLQEDFAAVALYLVQRELVVRELLARDSEADGVSGRTEAVAQHAGRQGGDDLLYLT